MDERGGGEACGWTINHRPLFHTVVSVASKLIDTSLLERFVRCALATLSYYLIDPFNDIHKYKFFFHMLFFFVGHRHRRGHKNFVYLPALIEFRALTFSLIHVIK